MAENNAERKLLEIDPRTVVVGSVRRKFDYFKYDCPLARGRDGVWYFLCRLADESFGLKGRKNGKDVLPDGYVDCVRELYEKTCEENPGYREHVVLGVAAKVVGLRELEYNPYYLGLWHKIGENDGLQSVFKGVSFSDGYWTNSERIK